MGLHVAHTNIFVWHSQIFHVFFYIEKSCEIEQWPKESLLTNVWLNILICDLRQNRGWNIFESLKSWYMTKSIKHTQSRIWFQFVSEAFKSSYNKQSKLNFRNRLHTKMHFYVVSWQKQPPDDPTIIFWPKASLQFGKLWPTCFFWHQV